MTTPSKKIVEWETDAAQTRLIGRHHLALAGKAARRRKATWMKDLATELHEELATWRYHGRMIPPNIEVAWIIHSQIAWKGHHADRRSLFADLEFTDPARVLADESAGPESNTPIPQEKLLALKHIIVQLENFGYDLKDAEFSRNWTLAPGSTKSKNTVGVTKWKPTVQTKAATGGGAATKARRPRHSLIKTFFTPQLDDY